MIEAIVVDSDLSNALLPPLPENTVAGAVDYKGRPALRSKHGRWRSACFIIVVGMAERIAYFGVASNLITYLTEGLGESTVVAAANVNVWTGVTLFLPVLGAVMADSFVGKYYTIVASTFSTSCFRREKAHNTALEHGLIDLPNAIVPMSISWVIPQYVLGGTAEAFTLIGLQEFFYDQVPKSLRSVGISLYLSVLGIGSLLGSLLVSIIDKATSSGGKESWFSNNLDRAHLDYFYLVIAGISALGLGLFIFYAKLYAYKN